MDDRRVASAVRDAMLHFAGDRYDVFAFVVMPNHVHWVFRPLPAWNNRRERGGDLRPAREVVVHSFCRHSALVCNRLLQRSGPFWQHESYDRVVRNDGELQRIVDYIEFNPVKAGLCGKPDEWEFSSASAVDRGWLVAKPMPRC
jgi:REP element-mobilizing transposase RayT